MLDDRFPEGYTVNSDSSPILAYLAISTIDHCHIVMSISPKLLGSYQLCFDSLFEVQNYGIGYSCWDVTQAI